MPFFKAAGQIIYYAHVPKCGGSAVEAYLADRFGALAFHDSRHGDLPEGRRWTRSSPQHVDAAALARLIPPGFFDAAFAVVRHPVARLVSTYHFQMEREGAIAGGMGFSDWLARLDPDPADAPFAYDNHIRPMDALVPAGATVFHLEHGLAALIPWLDGIAGSTGGPRVIGMLNARGGRSGGGSAATRETLVRAEPTPADLDRIAALYAADFARFGYVPDRPAPDAPPPALDPAALAEQAQALAALRSPLARLARRLRRRLGRGLGRGTGRGIGPHP